MAKVDIDDTSRPKAIKQDVASPAGGAASPVAALPAVEEDLVP
ncbi:hypothetical protein ACWCPJ_33690 [Streptomyces collinus]